MPGQIDNENKQFNVFCSVEWDQDFNLFYR